MATEMRRTPTRRHRYGQFGKHLDTFDLFEAWRRNPKVLEALAEEQGWGEDAQLAEGTGAPEGRADFPLFLLSITRHKIVQGFQRRAAQWDRYFGVVRAEDFRQHTASQLNGLTGMAPVPEFGEYPRLRSSEQGAPPYSVGKHGGIYGVTFEMVVNDDTNEILNRTPTELGKMSAAYISQVGVALLESNPNWIDGLPFFTTTARQGLPTGNEYTGSAAEPSEDNLVTIIGDLRGATDEMGFPLQVDPGLVITKDLRVQLAFRRIVRSQRTGTVSNDTDGTTFDKGDYNAAGDILPGDDPVLVEDYFRDPNDWILLADTGKPAFQIAFLRDQRTPFIGLQNPGVGAFGGGASDPYTLDFDEIPIKVRHVFGHALGYPQSARRARRS